MRRASNWRFALEVVAGIISANAISFAGMERRVHGEPVPPPNYHGGWFHPHGEPGRCLAVNDTWLRLELAKALPTLADFQTLTRAWLREGVLVPNKQQPKNPRRQYSSAAPTAKPSRGGAWSSVLPHPMAGNGSCQAAQTQTGRGWKDSPAPTALAGVGVFTGFHWVFTRCQVSANPWAVKVSGDP